MTAIHRSHPLLVAASFVALLTLGTNAWGQQDTVYIGGASPRGSVMVDTSVLDSLGTDGGFGRQTLTPPAPRGAVEQHITLKPPGQKPAVKPKPQRATTKAQPVTPRKAPAPTTKTAAAKSPAVPLAAPPSPPPAPVMSEMPPPPPAPNDIAMPPTPQSPDPKGMVVAATKPPPAADVPPPAAAPRDIKPAPAVAPVAAVKEPAPVPAAPQPAPLAAAPKPAAPQIQPQVPPPQVASVPPAPQASSATGRPSMRISFAGDGATLPEPSKGELKQIATALGQDPALRVQVMAYANGGDDASKARRLSLSRALAVRTYLIEQGVGSTRIDVRALGNAAEGGPVDRVDLMMLSR